MALRIITADERLAIQRMIKAAAIEACRRTLRAAGRPVSE